MISFNDFVEATRESEAQAIALSSLNTYDTYLRSYENTMKKIPDAPPPYPITEDKIRGFLHYKLNQSEHKIEYSTFKLFIASFSHYFVKNKEIDVTKNTEFRNYVKSVQRKLGTSPHNDKKPITKENMMKISEIIDRSKYEEVKLFTAMSLSFYGFLRYSEVRNLRAKDVKMENDGIYLTICHSKNDPLGKGTLCFIAKNNKTHNPCDWFRAMLSMKPLDDDDYLFDYSNQTFSRKIRECLRQIGVMNFSQFSSHSLRKGGANAAAKEGIQDNIIQRHGRWQSTIFMQYTKMERKEAGIQISSLI